MAKLFIPPSEALYPIPVVLVSCINKDNKKANILTIAWCGVVCSKPPLLSISVRPSRYSHKLIKESGDFCINVPTKDQLKKVDTCGIVCGSDTDKFKACSFTASPASKIGSPMIEECPLNIECRVKEVIKLGSHDMFIGEVLAVHVDSSITTKDGKIDFAKARPFVYNQGEYWDLGKYIGSYGFSSK